MKINLTKTSHILFFVAILPATSYFIGWYFHELFPDIPFWIESASPLFTYIILYTLFEKYAWHWKVFTLLKIVTVPDVRGRWIGKQRSTRIEDGENVVNDVAIEIKQSFSKIIVQAFYEHSSSESIVADFYELNSEYYLYYTYDNDPNSLKYGTMQIHRGTAKLQFNNYEKSLSGSYFNSIGNNGEIDVKFKQNRLVGRLSQE